MKIKKTYRRPVAKWVPITTSLGFAQSGQMDDFINTDEEINVDED